MRQKLYPLASLKRLKGKHKINTLMPFGHEMWCGEIDDGKYVVIGCINKTIKIKIAETEIDLYHRARIINVAKIHTKYESLSYITKPVGDCAIKLVLDLLEWEYHEDDIWC